MRKVDKLICIDLESLCWDNEGKSQLPRRDESEIIEIGICTLDLNSLEIEDSDGIIVKPYTGLVSEFCTQLTSLTQEDVDKGIPLPDACEILRKKYDSKNRIWASYGQYDKNMFDRECLNKHINYPFGGVHINIKGVVETIYGESLGMSRALDRMGIELEGRAHRGISDAYNLAKIYKQILKTLRQSIITYK